MGDPISLLAIVGTGITAASTIQQGRQASKQNQLNADIARNNAEAEQNMQKFRNQVIDRNKEVIKANLEIEEDIANEKFNVDEYLQRRKIRKQLGTARAKNLSQDVITSMLLEEEKAIEFSKILFEKERRKRIFETQEQLNQQEISRTEISFKSDRAVESSKLNAASFDAKAADRSYILSAAGQGLQGTAKAFSSSDLNLSSTPKSGSIAGSGSTTGNIIKK
ncbi:hypothetical protein KAR91_73540 [Candidatus Pacearchaeota archaeon]|nr:hypothetical protein [Candidatus Pacearchaeota archaeon]